MHRVRLVSARVILTDYIYIYNSSAVLANANRLIWLLINVKRGMSVITPDARASVKLAVSASNVPQK